ncbi:SCP2 sterol-binding domain-containing protein [Phytomonospora sp. NPDC050363]|uniref:SCP2 sterol-binding domain-containing protein n=1 Tax=Phytomonospora sp. NPDC050363 TaxID=3155642 RepID=UPI0033E0349C
MATKEECRQALDDLAVKLAENAESLRGKVDLDRRLACDITDLDVSFHGRLNGGKLTGLEEGDDPEAKIRLIVGSDDLLSLVAGDLDFGRAFTSGRVKIKANLFDLLKLKSLL